MILRILEKLALEKSFVYENFCGKWGLFILKIKIKYVWVVNLKVSNSLEIRTQNCGAPFIAMYWSWCKCYSQSEHKNLRVRSISDFICLKFSAFHCFGKQQRAIGTVTMAGSHVISPPRNLCVWGFSLSMPPLHFLHVLYKGLDSQRSLFYVLEKVGGFRGTNTRTHGNPKEDNLCCR